MTKVKALTTLAEDLDTEQRIELVKDLLTEFTRHVSGIADPFDREYPADDMRKVIMATRRQLNDILAEACDEQRRLREGAG